MQVSGKDVTTLVRSGLVALDDDTYRSLIKLHIAANSWDGTTDKAYQAWSEIFTGSQVVIEDHQDMSFSMGITGQLKITAQKAIFTGGLSPFKPAGIRAKMSTTSLKTVKLRYSRGGFKPMP